MVGARSHPRLSQGCAQPPQRASWKEGSAEWEGSAVHLRGGVSLRPRPPYSEARTTKPPALGPAFSIWSLAAQLRAFWKISSPKDDAVSDPWRPCPPGGREPEAPWSERGAGAEPSWGPGGCEPQERGRHQLITWEEQWGMEASFWGLGSGNLLLSSLQPARIGTEGTSINPQHPATLSEIHLPVA